MEYSQNASFNRKVYLSTLLILRIYGILWDRTTKDLGKRIRSLAFPCRITIVLCQVKLWFTCKPFSLFFIFLKTIKRIHHCIHVWIGFISSLCKDIHNSHYALFGVACIDMKLTNLLEEVAFFQHGQNSYAFVIDDKGRTVIHPALPKRTMSSDFVIVDIGTLEKGVSSVIESMKR